VRYLLITYVTRANGKIDEVMAVSRNLKKRDLQTCSVILDFKRLEVVIASMNGTTIPKDFNRVVEYYYQYYQSTIDRLFSENGLEVVMKPEVTQDEKQDNPN
jgi:negative regulator of genetic competence, sporulation and motility